MSFIEGFDLHHHQFKRTRSNYPKIKKILCIGLFCLSISMYVSSSSVEDEVSILNQQAKLVKSKKVKTESINQDYYKKAYGVNITPSL